MNCVRDQAIALPKPWPQMSQTEQQDYLDSAEAQIRQSVNDCVNVIACADVETATGILEQVVFKKGSAKGTIVFPSANEEVLGLAECTDHLVKLVVIPSIDNVIGETDLPTGEKHQRALELGNEYDESEQESE